MKRIGVLTIFCLFLGLSLAHAHPPASIDIKYDQAAKQITATIDHQVSNPKKHFIDHIILKANGIVLETKRFSFQVTAQKQIAVFAIPDAKPGDVIVLESYCNKGGRLSQQIRVE